MQVVSPGDNLYEMPKPIFWEKYIKKLSADIFTQHTDNIEIQEVPELQITVCCWY